jgi:hypothetical protein
MKTLTVLSLLAITALTVSPLTAHAQVGGIKKVPPSKDVNLELIVDNILGFAFGLLLVIASLFIIYAAFVYLTAAGNEDKVKSAKNYIIYAVVAILVALLSRAIVTIVRNVFAVPGGS